jgi:hypothetical protein
MDGSSCCSFQCSDVSLVVRITISDCDCNDHALIGCRSGGSQQLNCSQRNPRNEW